MKTIPAGLLSHYASYATTTAWGLKVTRTDAVVYGFTSHQRDVTISGTLYQAGPGLDVASLVSSAGFAVDNTELTILTDDVVITKVDVLAGRWDGAAWELFKFNWNDTSQGRDIRKRGTFGNVQPRRGAYTVELRSLRQALQQSIGRQTMPTCPYRLGDADCGVTLASHTVTGSVTTAGTDRQFTDSARTEANETFDSGELTWTSGDKAGLKALVRSSTISGVITLALPSVYPIELGDTYSMVKGCRKRRVEDCAAKFSNVLRFGGEPDLPGRDDVLKPAQFEG